MASAYYQRNTSAVRTALLSIIPADPEALGAYEPVARTIRLVRENISPIFMTVSFVGANALAADLGPEGAGVYVTQVVPNPEDGSIPIVASYQKALAGYDPATVPGFVSLEGYLAGRLALEGLRDCGSEITRECFLGFLRDGDLSLDGFWLNYSDNDNQGSDAVFLTVLRADGEYNPVDHVGGASR